MGQGRAGRGMQSGAERREGRMGRQVSSLSRWAVEQKLAGPPGGGGSAGGPRRQLSGRPRSIPVAWRPGHSQKRRAWDSNPQPVSRHHISSVAANHSLTLQTHVFLLGHPVGHPANRIGQAPPDHSACSNHSQSIPIGLFSPTPVAAGRLFRFFGVLVPPGGPGVWRGSQGFLLRQRYVGHGRLAESFWENDLGIGSERRGGFG